MAHSLIIGELSVAFAGCAWRGTAGKVQCVRPSQNARQPRLWPGSQNGHLV